MLKQLINKLCPHGVEYKRLGDILKRTTGTNITAKRMQQLHKEGGEIRIFGGGRTIVDVNHGDIPERDINRKPSIIVKSRGNIGFEYYEKPFSHKNEFWSYYSENEQINSKFVYYYLVSKINYFQNIGNTMQMPQISIPVTDNYLIPVPPIEVQDEIVRNLDKFTLLKAELETELETELEARTVQYHYYRDSLLNLSSTSSIKQSAYIKSLINHYCPEGIPFLPVEEVVKVITPPKKLNKKFYLETGDFPVINQGQDYIVGFTNDEDAILPENEYILFGDHTLVLKYVDFTFAQGADGLKILVKRNENLNTKFLYYSLVNLNLVSRGYSRHWSYLKRSVIAIPPLPVQINIVKILDRFETLVQDLQDGLPGEIALRQKQYEYYRDQLLSFKALKSEEKAEKTEPAIISRSSYDTI